MQRRISLLVFATALAANAPVHAFLGIDRLWRKDPNEPLKAKSRTPVNMPGYKVKVYKLQKAQAQDLEYPLQSYLNGIKSQGSLVASPADNSLIITEDPEILSRLDALVKEMDQAYNNPNAMARRMLASQAMIKAVRSLGINTAVSSRPSSSGPAPAAAPVNVTQLPQGAVMSAPLPEETSPQRKRIMEERPMVRAFQIIGWLRDYGGLVVILRNDGQRYVFRHGRLRYGSATSQDFVEGITGTVRGDFLILTDVRQGSVSLSLKPKEDRLR